MKEKISILAGIALILVIASFLTTCKKEYVEYSSNEQKAEKVIENASEIFPEPVLNQFEEYLKILTQGEGNEKLLDSITFALDDLKTMILLAPDLSFEDYKNTLDSTFANLNSLKSTTQNDCLGLAYSKSAEIYAGPSGSAAYIIGIGLEASGGGGVSYIYDFVNMDRQVYLYKFCTLGYAFSAGVSAALGANVGFTGLYELTSGVPYLGNSSGINKFNGIVKGKSYSISGSLLVLLGINVSVGVGTSKEALTDLSFPNNLMPFLGGFTVIENGMHGFFFQAGGSLSAEVGAEINLAFWQGTTGSEFSGVDNTYRNFGSSRPLAGLRMAAELLSEEPLLGVHTLVNPVDIVASCIAINYGQRNFSGCNPCIPAIGTLPVDNVSSNSAKSGGIIPRDNGAPVTQRGVCWNTSQNPTINNFKSLNGTGTGEFISNLDGLTGNTTYYIRAYAINTAGTSYGEEIYFTTEDGGQQQQPVVVTSAVENITENSALSGGNVTYQGASPVSARGVCWNTSPNPTIVHQKTEDGIGGGLFTSNITSLDAGTTYYLRAYATNYYGTAYGVEQIFETLEATGNEPIAAFIGSPTSGTAPLTVNFTDQSTNSPTSWAWDFGDGTTSEEQNPVHTYQNTGSYTVQLTATNGHGSNTLTKDNYITVTSGGGNGQPCPGTPTVTDIDGNVYNTVLIGDQCWMKENLNTTRDAAGNNITRYCYDNNTTNCDLYGGLYTWATVMNGAGSSNNNPSGVQGICPTGWHVPSDAEWTQLVDYVVSQGYPNNPDDTNGAGNALKSCRQVNSPMGGDCNTTVHPRWNSHVTHYGFDEFGFSAFPSGLMVLSYGNYVYQNFGYDGFWFTSTESSSTTAWYWFIRHYHGKLYRFSNVNNKMFGKSVRCIRD